MTGRNLLLAGIVVATFMLQIAFLGGLRPLGVVPNLFLVVVVVVGLLRPASETLVVALGGGLLFDLMSGTDFGLRMGFYVVLALVVLVLVQAGVDLHNFGIGSLVVAAATAAFNGLVLTGLLVARLPISWPLAARLVTVEIVCNLLLWLLARVLLSRALHEPSGVPQVTRGA